MIQAKFSEKALLKHINRRFSAIQDAIVSRLKYLGEICLVECRTNHTYMDQTGNLTASMGYIIVANGEIIDEAGFQGESEGSVKGKNYARSLRDKFRTGYALIVVAGMDYAAYVEAKGRNVLSSAELLAERELPKMLKQLENNLNKAK